LSRQSGTELTLFAHVEFRGPLVLTDISFHINSGERVAIAGPTGCGKSTLASLLPRFYDPVEGAVLVDGKDIQDFTISSLRRNISLVFQEPVLFATTIAENIAYGKPDASREEIKKGGTISGGQRQCVSIARAIIKNTPIVILDEPTSGLDSLSAELVMGALRELMPGKTIIIISHQIETICDVDRVLVLQRGSLIHEGTPENILSDYGLYQGFRSQKTGGLVSE
jgi:ATP-binding cassette subfamily B protein/subfamily B ATP-binding cassette protein MsbA